MESTAKKEKVCQEEECVDLWAEMPEDVRARCTSFVYCPFCANDMVTRCSACGETIHDVGFHYCPWCGVQFE